MAITPIDRDKLRAAIRHLDDEYVFYMLDDAIGLLPPAKLEKLVKRYLDLKKLCPDKRRRKQSLLSDVMAFEKASLLKEYYEDFYVDSKNYTRMSRGTSAWIADCCRLLDRCVAQASIVTAKETSETFEIIFSLLRRIDDGDDIVFFADESGSWILGIDWTKIFPAWFTCLAATVRPEEYARQVISNVDAFSKYHRDTHLATARSTANPAQQAAIQALVLAKNTAE